MFHPKYPTPDTAIADATPVTVEAALQPTPDRTPARPRGGVAETVHRSPTTAVLMVGGGLVTALTLAAVSVALLLAVAVTAVALSISAVVLLFLVRAVRDEIQR